MRWRQSRLLLAAAALVAAGCGSTAKTPAASTPTTTTSSSTPTTTSAAGDCNSLGINPTKMREGTCTHAGITYVIMDMNHTLKLQTLWAKLNGIHTTGALRGSAAQGKFIVASLTITNRLKLPQTFDPNGTQQAGLILNGTVYKEDTAAEKAADPSSCLSEEIRVVASKSETCDVIFDVPASSVAALGKRGSGDLYIVDYGSDLAGSVSPQTVGQIRLYR